MWKTNLQKFDQFDYLDKLSLHLKGNKVTYHNGRGRIPEERSLTDKQFGSGTSEQASEVVHLGQKHYERGGMNNLKVKWIEM